MIAFFTHDLIPGRERLMPWRTIIEVCRYIQSNTNQKAAIYSFDAKPEIKNWEFNGITINSLPKYRMQDEWLFIENTFTHIFFPVTWRTPYKSVKALTFFRGKKTAYFPGGVYQKLAVIKSIKYIGIKTAIPYLFEAFISPKIIIKYLKKAHFDHIVVFTPYTKCRVIEAGFPAEKVHVILPGKDLLQPNRESFSYTLNGEEFEKNQYFLFMGAPHKIRGLELLLKAFNKACATNNNMKLVCFLRTDPESDNRYIDHIINKLRFKSNISIVWHEVIRDQLFSYVRNAKAVVLPFILIPSEIPLTYFEVLSLGTPIISTKNGGTTDYLTDSIILSSNSVCSYANKLLEVWDNVVLVNEKKAYAFSKMANHPDWEMTCLQWVKLL